MLDEFINEKLDEELDLSKAKKWRNIWMGLDQISGTQKTHLGQHAFSTKEEADFFRASRPSKGWVGTNDRSLVILVSDVIAAWAMPVSE